MLDALWIGSKLWVRLKPSQPPPRYVWKQFDASYLSAVCSATEKMLNSSDHPGAGMAGESFDQFMAAPMTAIGPTVSLERFALTKDVETIKRYLSRNLTSDGHFRGGITLVDQCMMGWPILEVYSATKERRYAIAAHEIYRYLRAAADESVDGLIPYRSECGDYRFVDTLGMVCPFLAYYGKIFQKPEAQNLAVIMLQNFLNTAMEPKSGLPFHAYSVGSDVPLGVVGWTRGTGWLMIGMVETIRHLPSGFDRKSSLSASFKSLADDVISWQDDNGYWGWNLNRVGSHIDTSGTAMIAYSIERGMHIGFLNISYRTYTDKALNALIQHTRADGLIDQAMGDCGGIGIYPQLYGTAAWVQGPTLALCSLVYDRKPM